MSYMRIITAIVLTGLAIPAAANSAFADETSSPISNAEFARERNAEIDTSMARFEAEKTAEFEKARNEEIDRAMASSRQAAFDRERNEEIDASLAAVAAERVREEQATAEAEF